MEKWHVLRQAEKGAETIEWAVVTVIVALAGIATLILVRRELGEMFLNVLGRFGIS
jgi:Flp pilus assembly pilin Flp